MKIPLLVLGSLAFIALSDTALAQRRYGMAGCGLGSAVMGRSGSQVSAATTNGTSYSKYLGITFATSNCLPDKYEQTKLEQDNFMLDNYSVLAKEIAQGDGPTLEGLAQLLGCEKEQMPSFKSFVQNEHQKIFAPPGALAALDTLKDTLQSNTTLAQSCKYAAIRNEVAQ